MYGKTLKNQKHIFQEVLANTESISIQNLF